MVRRSARIQYSGALKKPSSDQIAATATVAKQADEIKKLKTELKECKKELKEKNQKNQLQMFNQKLEDHKKSLTEKMADVMVRIGTKEELEKEKKEVEELKKKCLDMLKKQSNEAIEMNGGPFEWQICSVCLERFTEEDQHTPRVLKCGHTFCLGCITKLWKSGYIKCPTCREVMWCMDPATVTKNFMIADVSK
ncbi:unnamed protein product [Caenorhabditis brenneri]